MAVRKKKAATRGAKTKAVQKVGKRKVVKQKAAKKVAAKKKVAKTKVTKRKVTPKKVAKQKSTKKKATKKKTPKKNTTKKKNAKKTVAAKKVAKRKATKQKATNKKPLAKKKAATKRSPNAKAKAAKAKKKTVSKTRGNKPRKKVTARTASKKSNTARLTKLAGISQVSIREHARRRQRLMEEMTPGSIAVLPAAQARTRNKDVEYLFRQDSDFYYLTGCVEADAWLVLAPGREHGEVILFCAERDVEWEQWNGTLMGPERATQLLGVDDAFPVSDVGDILPGMLEGRERIYATLGEYPEFDRQLLAWVKGIRARESGGARPPGEFVALKHLLHEQRLYKSAAELVLMREAARITADAHERAMRAAAPGITEGQLEAELTHEFMRNGARSPAYPCIVGSGSNACILHYIDNDQVLRDGDLVLIDAGCEYAHYAADVTRTFPVSGRFTSAQKTLYELVLEANERGIDACRQGNSFNDPHEVSLRVMLQGLIDLGLLAGSVDGLIESGEFRRFCPHKASHWLGIDVHDVGDYRIDDTWRELEPGMVLTIEPGIYVPQHAAKGVASRWVDIGIRIEDDVLVTSDGPEVLTRSAPKTVADIERTMRGG